MKIFLGIAFWAILFLAIGCNRDDITFESPSQLLRFSTDTVFCDTVYSQMRSETYAVKVYNRENKDVKIPRIYLEGGNSSLYRINVDGKSGTDFQNVALRKNDSLYIFVEIAPVANAPEAIAEDKVVFESPAGQQKVTLFSVVQDAEYFIQTGANPVVINENTTWTKDKVKVIFGNLEVAEGKTLTLEKGTKVYFRKNSGMSFKENSVLNINGELGDEVIFRGDRSDTKYDTLPANWNGIKMEAGSTLNMNYARVFGGNVGLQLKKNTATINNSMIHTFQNIGIYGIGATITANNLVMNNCGEADIAMVDGGNYTFNFCTIANYWNLTPGMTALAMYASDSYVDDDGNTETGNPTITVKNSIIYGDLPDMIVFDGNDINADNFEYTLLKYSPTGAITFTGNNIIRNEDPKFQNYFTYKMNLRLKNDSPARNKGFYDPAIPTDIDNVSRGNPPTLGAYEIH